MREQRDRTDWYSPVYNMSVQVHSSSEYKPDLHIYKVPQPIDWCQAFTLCHQAGLQLAVGVNQSDQQIWSELQPKDVYNGTNGLVGYVWVSARRKDFGNSWTWLDDNLNDCTQDNGEVCSGTDQGT